MSITFPDSLDSLTNPNSTDTLDSPSHSDQHSDINDAVEALEAKVGADGSAVTSSHDYKIDALEDAQPTGDIVGTTDTQTLTNKTIENSELKDSDITLGTAGRIQGYNFALNDDTATSFTPSGSRHLVMIYGTNQTGHFGIAIVWTSPNLGEVQVNGASGTFEATNTALTGTTGTDGKFTVSGYNGKIYIENRLGADRSFGLVLFS